MTHRIALTFEEGTTFFVDCAEDESLVDAGERRGIRIPTDCREGICGTCRSLCERGDFVMSDDYLEEALSDDEAAEGFILACQTRPLSDMVVHVPVSSTVAGLRPQLVAGSVAKVSLLSSSTAELIIDTGDESSLQFLPGQYVGLRVGGLEVPRNYSFSNASGGRFVEFLIRLLPGGGMSEYLTREAQMGDPVEMHGPQGAFYLRDVIRPAVFVAGGTGLAPFLSMLETLTDRADLPPVTLLLGVTNDDDLVKIDELVAFKNSHSWFDFGYRIANPASGNDAGFVTDLLGPKLGLDEADLYLCGPPAMVNAVHKYLRSEACEPARVFTEKFVAQTVATT